MLTIKNITCFAKIKHAFYTGLNDKINNFRSLKWCEMLKVKMVLVGLCIAHGIAISQTTVNDNPIDGKEMMSTVKYLSSERFKGRMSCTVEYEQASRYVATRFKNAGLKPLIGNTMLQEFDDEVNYILDARVYLIDNNNRPIHPMQLGEDFVCRGYSGSGEVRGEVVFVGFGIKTDEYNDYRSIDVRNKIVAVFKSTPPWKPQSGSWGDVTPRGKARIARELGAKAIIFIGEPHITPNTMIYGSVACGAKPHLADFPMIHACNRFVDSLFSQLPYKPFEYFEMIKRDKAPHSIETGKSVYIKISAEYHEAKKTYNVVGYIEGSDLKLKNEYVILGAHLDHVGYQGDKLYFPGANDNASGVAGLIAIAEAIKKSPTKPRRSIVFVAFSSEESGLKGSKYFVNNMPFPAEQTVAMLNFDCIGQGDSIAIGGRLSYPKLWKKTQKLDRKNTKLLSHKTFGGGGADAQAFHEIGIPTLYFNTSGGYKFLHQTTDKPETLNPIVFEKGVHLGYLTTMQLANGKYKREKDKQKK